jgi:hypothetical protein
MELAGAGLLSVVLAFFAFFCGGFLVAQAVVCWVAMTLLQRIPEAHRRQSPAMVWLMMIPLFNLVWHFFVYPRIAESYRSYFAAEGSFDGGDFGAGLALAFCIVAAACIVPGLSELCFLGAFVLWILMIVKFFDLRRRIPIGAAR